MADAANHRRLRRLGIAFVALAVVAGGTLYGIERYRAPAVDHAVRLVPSDAEAYLHVFLKPSTLQRRALQKLLERFPSTDDEREAEHFADDLLREVLSRFDLDVDDGAGEWLGDEAAAFLPSGGISPVVMLAVEDEQAARSALSAALGERLGRDASMAFVDGFMIIGTRSSVRSVDRERESLDDVDAYAAMTETLDPHRVALLYLSKTAVAMRTLNEQVWTQLLPEGDSVTTLSVREDRLVIDTVAFGWSVPIQGFLSAALTGVDGAVNLDFPTRDGARAARASLVEAYPSLESIVSQRGRALTGSIGEVAGFRPRPDEIPDDLTAAATARLEEGHPPVLTVNLGGLPAQLRSPLLASLDEDFRTLGEKLLTLDIGVRDGSPYALSRLVLRFSDA